MFEVIATIAVVIAIAIAVVLILALSKPDIFRIQRIATIKAPAETVFALINDFHRWGSWSPWESRDPAMKRTYSGAERGKGAVYAWDGDKNVGSGRMEILDVSAPSKIVIKLDFFKPFEGHNTAEFTMLPQGDGTHVTWVMHGPTKIMHARITVDGEVMMASDATPGDYHQPQGFSVALAVEDPADAERRFKALAEGGTVRMPFGQTFFSNGFGMCVDKFGIPWMVN